MSDWVTLNNPLFAGQSIRKQQKTHLSPLPILLSSHFDLLISMPTDITSLPPLPSLPMDNKDDSTAAAESESVGGGTGQHWVKPSMADPFVPPPSSCAVGGRGVWEKVID